MAYLLGDMLFDGLYFVWRARFNSGDWEWLAVASALAILGIVVFGLLWRHGIVTLEIGVLMQALVYVSYRETLRYHFTGDVSVRAIIRSTGLMTAAIVSAVDEVLKAEQTDGHQDHPPDQGLSGGPPVQSLV
ncbi:MAG: hypothetical protein IMX00_04960 [Limnochordales bacterium]|nr:hypothetical protein [Limnochordales bacterium]